MNDRDPMETIEMELAVLVRRVTSVTADKRIGSLDRSAYLLLHQILSRGSAGVKTLAEEFRLDISTVSRQASALESKGYVRRKPDPTDGRAYAYEITPEGLTELEATKAARLKRLQELVGDWTEAEREEFGRLLVRFNRAFLD